MKTARQFNPTRDRARWPVAVLVSSLVVWALFGLSLRRAAHAQPSSATAKQVTLTIDYGDGVEKRFKAIPWREGMTMLDAMKFAQKHPRGIKYRMVGRGKTAMLTSIDDLANRGGRGSKANWIYRVNGKLGTCSFAIRKLKPKDAVQWRFGAYR